MQKNKVISSFAFKLSERLAVKGIGLIISVVLARLLAPEEFGQIAIITVFTNLSTMLVQAGFASSLVQKKDVTEADYSTAFYISLGGGIILAIVLNLAAPFIGNYYESEALVMPLKIYAFSILFSAFNSVQSARMQREMRFRDSMICTLAATILSGALGIAVALKNPTIWALIVYYFSHIVFNTIAMGIATKWRPRLLFSVIRAKDLFSYGWKILVAGVLCSLYEDARTLIIGKIYSTEDLATYKQGDQYPNLIGANIETSIQSVLFPVLARSQDSKEQTKSAVLRSISVGALMLFPIMFGLFSVADTLIPVLLTETWLAAVPFLQILSISYLTRCITSPQLTAIKAIGRSDVYMRLEIVRRIVMLAILAVSLFAFHSTIVIALGATVSAFVDAAIISVVAKRYVGHSLRGILQAVWKSFAASALMVACVFGVDLLFSAKTWFSLILECLVGVAAYLLSCILLHNEAFFYCFDILKDMLKKGKKQKAN